ncbi:MAG: DUF1801 domain-containing protein [Chloroflexi bacterium]|nr:DUF1801 domain-containing protein [Chloroflexota bacterium]
MQGHKKPPSSIDEYIAGFPAEVQKTLREIREVIKTAAPEAEEKISYQIPTFYLNGNLIHFAAYKNHIGIYPTSGGIEKFETELSAYKESKGTLRFSLHQPIPYDLISQIVKFRVKENLDKTAEKQKKNKKA